MRPSLFKHHINGLYNKVIMGVPHLVPDGKIGGLYNSKRFSIVKKNDKHSYEGYKLCGAVSHIIYYALDKPVIKCIHSRGKGRNLEDHVFLKYNDILIDGTYRQMFRSRYGSGDEDYFKLLYEEYPPFFVGTMENMEIIYDDLNTQHKRDFKKPIKSPMEFYEKAIKYEVLRILK
jgi:hypothetical protein